MIGWGGQRERESTQRQLRPFTAVESSEACIFFLFGMWMHVSVAECYIVPVLFLFRRLSYGKENGMWGWSWKASLTQFPGLPRMQLT